MKKLLFNISIFLLPVLILLIVFEILLRKIPNDYLAKRISLERLAPSIKVLVLGSSHSYYNINPEYFSMPAYNAAHSSQTLKYDWKLFDKYSKHSDSLEFLLLPISYFSFYESMENDTEAWRIKNYSLYSGIEDNIPLRYRFEVTSLPVRINVKRISDYYLQNKNTLHLSPKGFATDFTPDSSIDLQQKGIDAVRRNTKKDDSFTTENYEYLLRILEKAKSENVRVVLFTPPAYNSYSLNLNVRQQAGTNKMIAEILRAHPGVLYRNYINDPDFERNDFYDADHLNTIGAKKFTLKVNKLLDSLQIR